MQKISLRQKIFKSKQTKSKVIKTDQKHENTVERKNTERAETRQKACGRGASGGFAWCG